MWEWQHAIKIPLLSSFLYLFNEDESLASPCVLAKINSIGLDKGEYPVNIFLISP